MSFLPGMFPAGAALGAAALTTLSVVSNTFAVSSAANVSITIPTVQDGDLLILQTYSQDGINQLAAFANIPGWTTATTSLYPTIKRSAMSLHCKIATAADSGTVISGGCTSTGSGSTQFRVKQLLVVRGDVPITLVNVGSADGEASLGNPAAQAITLPGAGVVFAVAGYVTSGVGQTVASRVFTISGVDAKDAEYRSFDANDYDMWLAWKSFNAGDSQATPVIADMATAGDSHLHSCYLACA